MCGRVLMMRRMLAELRLRYRRGTASKRRWSDGGGTTGDKAIRQYDVDAIVAEHGICYLLSSALSYRVSAFL